MRFKNGLFLLASRWCISLLIQILSFVLMSCVICRMIIAEVLPRPPPPTSEMWLRSLPPGQASAKIIKQASVRTGGKSILLADAAGIREESICLSREAQLWASLSIPIDPSLGGSVPKRSPIRLLIKSHVTNTVCCRLIGAAHNLRQWVRPQGLFPSQISHWPFCFSHKVLARLWSTIKGY